MEMPSIQGIEGYDEEEGFKTIIFNKEKFKAWAYALAALVTKNCACPDDTCELCMIANKICEAAKE